MKLYIDGVLIPPSEYGGNVASVDITDNESNDEKSIVITEEYTLTGNAYEMVKAAIIDDTNGKNEFLSVKIYEDKCCDTDVLLFEGIIRGDSVNWCFGECSCKVNFFEHTDETKKIDCIKTTLIWDNWNNFQSQAHPRIVYCVEMRPSILQQAILIYAVYLNILLLPFQGMLAVLNLIVSIILAIITAVNSLLPGTPIPTNGLEEFQDNGAFSQLSDLLANLNENVVGCGRKHPSPLVRDYIENACGKCGLTFQSSIFNDVGSDYYDTVYMFAPVEKGTRDESVLWIDQNKPIITLEGLLEQLKIPFSGDWDVQGTVLRFEREDFFWSGATFVNYSVLETEELIQGKLCLSWRDEQRNAYARFEYSKDPVDLCGNEAQKRFCDLVEWNIPFSELQKGVQETILPFGMPRFRDDGIDKDVLSDFSGWLAFGIGDVIQNHERVLIMNNGTCFQPKLLIWDGDVNFGRVKTYDISGFTLPDANFSPANNYNFPYQFNEHGIEPNTAYTSNLANSALYQRFQAWKNPKLIPDRGLEFTFSFKYHCDTLSLVSTAKFVSLPMGTGRIKKVVVNLDTKTITVSGKV